MGKLKLYYFNLSPASKSVLLTIQKLKLDVEYQHISTPLGEQFEPSFLKINPQHTVPVLVDDDDIILDGSAISNYLVAKYGGAEHASLCPTEPFSRALVEQRQHFSDAKLFNLYYKQMTDYSEGRREYDADDVKSTLEALDMLEIHLGVNDYVTGRSLTVADFACVATGTALLNIVPYDAARYPKILAWIQRMALLPSYKDIVETTNETTYNSLKERTGLDNRK